MTTLLKHTIYTTRSIEWFIEKLPRLIQKSDVVNLWIKSEQSLIHMDLNGINLEETERLYAKQLASEQKATFFILRRKLLKKIISRFKNITPPFLSHSNKNGSLFYSFSQSYKVGADIEEISSELDFATIARLFFSESERNRLQSKRKSSIHSFFQMWTRKEALAKCAQIPLLTILKCDLSPNRNSLLSTSVEGDHYCIYSYRKKGFYISIAASNFLKTIKTYELGIL